MTEPRYVLRSSPSGPRVEPVEPGGLIGWNAGSNRSIVILPAGHPPGVYTVGLSLFVRTASGAGAFTGTTLTWGLAGGGLSSNALVPGAPTTTGAKLNAYRSLPSSGLLPILYNLVVVGITGNPVIDVAGYAMIAALNPP